MKLLLVEDNNLKYDLLASYLKDCFPESEVIRAASYQAGIEKLVYNKFDYVLLDMTLPVSDLEFSPVGMDFLTLGGEYILRECFRKKIRTKIIVVSQYKNFVLQNRELSFDQLRDEILPKYVGLVIGFVHLDRTAETWKVEISNLLNHENINH